MEQKLAYESCVFADIIVILSCQMNITYFHASALETSSTQGYITLNFFIQYLYLGQLLNGLMFTFNWSPALSHLTQVL
jgi:hypothetical protein